MGRHAAQPSKTEKLLHKEHTRAHHAAFNIYRRGGAGGGCGGGRNHHMFYNITI